MQPTQSMPPQKPGGKKNKKQVSLALVVAVAVLAVAGLVGSGLYLGGAFATEVVAEPFDSPGVDPFGSSVGDGQSVPITPIANIRQEAAAAPAVSAPNQVTSPQPVAPVTTAAAPPADSGALGGIGPSASPTGNSVTGDTVGLYGGTNQNACDAAKLVAFLQANPDKAKAWADVELVPVDQIQAFVATLTPVILRTDTAVINHGFRDGIANPFNAVLQAGTAVMVDRNGIPRVRCKCGNPLLPPKKFGQVKYSGTRWLGFDERNITYIDRSPTPVTAFRVVMLCNCGYGPPTLGTPLVPPGATTPGVSTGTGTGTGTGSGSGTGTGTGTNRTTRPGATVPQAVPGVPARTSAAPAPTTAAPPRATRPYVPDGQGPPTTEAG